MKGIEKIKNKMEEGSSENGDWKKIKAQNEFGPKTIDIRFVSSAYLPSRFLNSWVTIGTTVKRSPTIP